MMFTESFEFQHFEWHPGAQCSGRSILAKFERKYGHHSASCQDRDASEGHIHQQPLTIIVVAPGERQQLSRLRLGIWLLQSTPPTHHCFAEATAALWRLNDLWMASVPSFFEVVLRKYSQSGISSGRHSEAMYCSTLSGSSCSHGTGTTNRRMVPPAKHCGNHCIASCRIISRVQWMKW